MAGEAKTPTITVRKDEVNAVVEILEDESYESAEKMARALLKATFSMLLARDWWIVGTPGPRAMLDRETEEKSLAGVPILFGPYPTDGAAMKALKDESLGLSGTVGIFHVSSPTKQGLKFEEMDNPASKTNCATCGHNRESHDWPRPRIPGCVGKGCTCTRYVKP